MDIVFLLFINFFRLALWHLRKLCAKSAFQEQFLFSAYTSFFSVSLRSHLADDKHSFGICFLLQAIYFAQMLQKCSCL